MKQFKSLKRQRGFISGLMAAAPLIGAGLSFIGGERRNSAQASAQNSANESNLAIARENNANSIAMARESNKLMEKLSNTAYQRAMKDMRKGGLNPILAGKYGGAVVPGMIQPNLHSAQFQAPQYQDTLSPAVNSAMTQQGVGLMSGKVQQEVANLEAVEGLTHQQITRVGAEIDKIAAETARIQQATGIQENIREVGDVVANFLKGLRTAETSELFGEMLREAAGKIGIGVWKLEQILNELVSKNGVQSAAPRQGPLHGVITYPDGENN